MVAAAAAAASVNVTSAKFVRNPLAKQDEFIVNGTTVRIMWAHKKVNRIFKPP